MLSAYPVVIDFVLRWADMDALGHINNTVFMQCFESARIAYLERLGIEVPGLGTGEHGVILAANSCRYLAPVVYPDTLSVGARVSALGHDRVTMEHAAVSRESGRTVAKGDASVVFYDYVARRTTRLTAERRAAIIAVEGHEPPALPPHARRRSGSA